MEGSSRRTALPKDNTGGEERTEGGARRTAIGKGGKRRDQAGQVGGHLPATWDPYDCWWANWQI